jgi:hypothetical protein
LWLIRYYRTGTIISFTPAFCQAWVFIGSSMYISVFILMAWASIERHILIFHAKWFATKNKMFSLSLSSFEYMHPVASDILFSDVFHSTLRYSIHIYR